MTKRERKRLLYQRLALFKSRKRQEAEGQNDNHKRHLVPRFGCRECYAEAFPEIPEISTGHTFRAGPCRCASCRGAHASKCTFAARRRSKFRNATSGRSESTSLFDASDSTAVAQI